MKTFDLNNMPEIKANGVVEAIENLDTLEKYGVNNFGASLLVGDTVEFYPEYTPAMIKLVEITAGSDTRDIRIAVEKNGEPAWVSLGFFNRRDADGKPVHAVAEKLHLMRNNLERLKALAGTKITSEEAKEYKRTKFVDGQPVVNPETKKNEYDMKLTPDLKFV